jgi:hypothetical protein
MLGLERDVSRQGGYSSIVDTLAGALSAFLIKDGRRREWWSPEVGEKVGGVATHGQAGQTSRGKTTIYMLGIR